MKHIAYFFVGIFAGLYEAAKAVGELYASPFIGLSKFGKEWLDERRKNG